MLTLDPNEINIANSFLRTLGTNIEAIEFIHKNNTYYNSKTKEELKDILSYILLKHPNTSDIHIGKGMNGVRIQVRIAGQSHNLSVKCTKVNNYKTIEIDGIIFLNSYFTRHIKNILNPEYIQEDFIDHVSIPLCGSYRLRSATAGQDAIIRLLKMNNRVDESLIKSNVLYLQEKPYYIIDATTLEGFLDESSIKLTDSIKEQFQLYKTTISDVFNHLTHLTNTPYYVSDLDLKLKLEQQENQEIKATVLKNYMFLIKEENMIIDYLIENYKVFYNPIFSHFIENCLGVEKDGIIGDFKSPEALKDYIIAIKMLKI